MTEQIIALIGKRGIAFDFDDRDAAALYLSQLGIHNIESIPVITAPPMSNLLVKAFAFLKENRDGTADGFLGAIAGTPEEGASEANVRHELKQATTLLDVLYPDRTKMSDEELARELFYEHRANGGNAITAMKALGGERPYLGLTGARKAMRDAGLYP